MGRQHFTPSFQLTLILVGLMLAIGLAQPWTEPLLEFNRTAIADGQWWRLLGGQWVHYGFYHLAMNSAALALCGYVLLRQLALPYYLLLLLCCLITVGLGLYWLNPKLEYYAGLSGALHGLLVAGLFDHLKQKSWVSVAALILVALKLIQEQSANFDASHPLLPVPVAVDAHLYGALAGLIWGLISLLGYLTKKNLNGADR